MPESKWLERFLSYLCDLYEFWGGSCSELPVTAPERISFLTSLYQEQGPPPLTSQPQIDEFLALLDVMSLELSSPSNCLPAASTAEMRTLIYELQSHFHPPER